MEPSLSRLLARVVEVFERGLLDSPDAQRRLASWGIGSPSLHRLGYVSGALLALVSAKTTVLDQLKRLGLVDDAGRERFVGTIALPALDEAGDVAQIAFLDDERSPSWLFDSAPTWFNLPALKLSREVRIVRDPLEALTKGAVAPAGPPSKLTDAARALLLGHGVSFRIPIEFAHELALPVPQRVKRQSDGFSLKGPRGISFVVVGIAQESPRHLRASLRVMKDGTAAPVHLDTLDLYHAKSRSAFAKNAGCLLGEEPMLVEQLLTEVVSAAEDWLRDRGKVAPAVAVSDAERAEAMNLLLDPKLLDRVLADLATLGLVGEETNKLVAFAASVSRKLDDPLSVLVVSRSGAGKSTLAEAAAMLAPPEEVLRFTRLTPQTLYYQKPNALAHKLLLVEEDKGVEEAAYALRALQSARRLSISTASGQGEARRREVHGPVSLFVTTTRTDIDEETAARFLVVTADETPEQTRRILEAQREAEAKPPAERERILRIHANAQRLLRPLGVVNPWAPQLAFPHARLSARRDQKKYLALIRAVAFLHQHQRAIDGGAVVVALEDITIANRLANEALGQSLFDLSPSSRRLLVEIREWLIERGDVEAAFRQRDLRERTGWKKSQLAEHVRELVECEYLLARTLEGRMTYRLDWDGRGLDGQKFFKGLTDPSGLVRLPSGSQETAPIAPPGPAKAGIDPSERRSGKRRL